MSSIGRPVEILLVEDNPGDIRLTQEAFKEGKVANNMNIVQDGVEAMAFLPVAARVPVGLVVDVPEPELIAPGLVLVGREERRLRDRLDEVVLYGIGHSIDELLLCRAVVQTRMNPGPRAKEMPIPLPCLVDASRDEAVRRSIKTGQVVHLLLGERELLVKVCDVGLEAVQLDGELLEGSPHCRADGVDDAGLGDDVVARAQCIERAGFCEEWILGMVVWLKEELAIDGSDR